LGGVLTLLGVLASLGAPGMAMQSPFCKAKP
jgi:hypothetical protein